MEPAKTETWISRFLSARVCGSGHAFRLCALGICISVYIYNFFMNLAAAHCWLVALHWGQSHPKTSFAVSQNDPLWVLDPDYFVLPPPLPLRLRVRLSLPYGFITKRALPKAARLFNLSMSVIMTVRRSTAVISNSRDQKSLFLKQVRTDGTKTV